MKAVEGHRQDAGALHDDFQNTRSVLECASPLAPWVQRRKVNNQKPVVGCRESKPPSGNHTKEQFVTAALAGVARTMSFLISSSRYQPGAK
jgi:hypothetical protein